MELILALDLMQGQAVHGKSGERSTYRPLVPYSDPINLIARCAPKSLYIADLDRIMGTGAQDDLVQACALQVDRCYVDRGCRSPADFLADEAIMNIAGTETAGDLRRYHGGYVSMDLRDGKVIPSGENPPDFLERVSDLGFEGAIVLNLGAVGTGTGIPDNLRRLREVYPKRLLYGGGVRGKEDLDPLAALGFDGTIVATGVFSGAIPSDAVRRGIWP
ncbi:MAG: nickel transporter [Methanomicrobiales archaeon]|nr:nickel transporter [Methanomicrobiales archaeon]